MPEFFPEKGQTSFESREALKKRQYIAEFALQNKLTQHAFHIDGKTLLALSQQGLDDLDQSKVAAYIRQHVLAKVQPFFPNCFSTADLAYQSGTVTGSIYSKKLVRDVVGWASHCINTDQLLDGSNAAIDLTASSNLDLNQRQFDVFLLRAKTMSEVISLVEKFYGGQWQIDK